MEIKYSKDKKVLFYDADHKYTDVDGNRLKSVTTLLHDYIPPFDPTGIITENYAKKHDLTVEFVKAMWKEENLKSTIYGSAVHLELEHYILTGEIRDTEYRWIVEAFAKIPFAGKLHAEVLIHSLMHMVAGQVDVVEDLGNKTINIWDFKGLALDTPIPTLEGFKNMENINVGDQIFDGDGNITNVTNVSNIHYNPCYKITFDTNDVIICDHEHKWVISNRKQFGVFKTPTFKILQIEEEKTTEDLFNLFNSKKIVKIKITPNLNTKKKDLIIDPYVLGVWLGDGSNATGMITNMNIKLWKEIENRGYILGKDISGGGSGLAQSRTIFGLRTQLNKLNLLYNKHIPDIYLRASYEQKLDLLRGIMDTDGHYNKIRKRSVLITTNELFANGLMELTSSMGIKATKCKAKTFCTNKGCDKTKKIDTFHISFTTDVNNPFLSRNENFLDDSKRLSYIVKSKYRYIKNIEVIDTVPTKCLTVDSPTHTYLAGRTYIKTHNTNKELAKSSKYGELMYEHCWYMDSCNFNHYTLQLSMYAYLCELKGLKINKLIILYVNRETKEMEQHEVKYKRKDVKQMLDKLLLSP